MHVAMGTTIQRLLDRFNFLKRVLNILHYLMAQFLPMYNGKEYPTCLELRIYAK